MVFIVAFVHFPRLSHLLPVGSFRSLVPHLLQSPTSCNAQQEKSLIHFRPTTIHSVLHLLFPTHTPTQVKRCSAFGRQQIKSPSHYSTFFGILQFLKVKKRAAMPFGYFAKATQLVTFIAFLCQLSR